MLTTIKQVNEEFFRQFFNLTIGNEANRKHIPCMYARKSSYDFSEGTHIEYPCIAIQDYAPTLKDEWYIDMRQYFGGKSFDGLSGYLYNRPIWMNFRYDVSIVTKHALEFTDLQDLFLERFVYGERFLFNKHFEGENAIGDIVPYTVGTTDVPRNDGVFEMNYEFNCQVWLYPKKAEEVELVQKIILNLENRNL